MTSALVVTTDSELVSLIDRCAAAAGCAVVHADGDRLARLWVSASIVIVGVDALDGAVASMTRRPAVVVAGLQEPDAGTWKDALVLGAEHVITLPDAQGWLVDRLGAIADAQATCGQVTAVIGSAGGLGASTLALALGAACSDRGHTALVVDADPWGGGLECVAGCDDEPGARWSTVDQEAGRFAAGALQGAFPQANGASVLSFPKRTISSLTPGALSAMVEGARRSFTHTVIDLPRSMAIEAQPEQWVLVTADRVRAVLTARALLDRLVGDPVHIVLRRVGGGLVDPKDAAHVLGRAIDIELPHDRIVAEAGEHGDPLPRRGPVISAASALLALLEVGP